MKLLQIFWTKVVLPFFSNSGSISGFLLQPFHCSQIKRSHPSHLETEGFKCLSYPPSIRKSALWTSRMCTYMSHFLRKTIWLPLFYFGFVDLMVALSYFSIALQCSQGKNIVGYFYNPLWREQLLQSNQQCDLNSTDLKRLKAKRSLKSIAPTISRSCVQC